jgi:hypothetical protein
MGRERGVHAASSFGDELASVSTSAIERWSGPKGAAWNGLTKKLFFPPGF